MGDNLAEFSEGLRRLRWETCGSAFLCWVIAELQPNLADLWGIKLDQAPPRSAVFLLALLFFGYCSVCFIVRFFAELYDAQNKLVELSAIRNSVERTEATMTGIEKSLAQFISAPPESSPLERVTAALSDLRDTRRVMREVGGYISRFGTIIGTERWLLAFIVPLLSAIVLVLLSMRHGFPLIGQGAAYLLGL